MQSVRLPQLQVCDTMKNAGLLLEIDGLLGDSQNPHYRGWMDLCWFSFGGSGEFGQTRPTDLATMTMPVSRVSTTLQLACLHGERFAEATFVALNPNHTAEICRATMRELQVLDFQFRGYSGDMPIHSLELRFSKLKTKIVTIPSKVAAETFR